jgi:hypothetical protein
MFPPVKSPLQQEGFFSLFSSQKANKILGCTPDDLLVAAKHETGVTKEHEFLNGKEILVNVVNIVILG